MAAANTSSRRIFELLDLVSASSLPVGVAEASARLGMPVSSAHRGLASLEASGMIAPQGNSPRYLLGPLPRRLLLSFFGSFPVRNAAMPHLRRMATATGQTASLWVRLGWYVVRIAAIEGTRAVIDRAPLGVVLPLDSCGPGLAIAGSLPEAERRRLAAFAAGEWNRETALTQSGARELARRGFADDSDAKASPLVATAFPLPGVDEVAFAAIAIEGVNARDLQSAGGGTFSDSLLEPVRELQLQVTAHARLQFTPFGHLDADGIHLTPESDVRGPGG